MSSDRHQLTQQAAGFCVLTMLSRNDKTFKSEKKTFCISIFYMSKLERACVPGRSRVGFREHISVLIEQVSSSTPVGAGRALWVKLLDWKPK